MAIGAVAGGIGGFVAGGWLGTAALENGGGVVSLLWAIVLGAVVLGSLAGSYAGGFGRYAIHRLRLRKVHNAHGRRKAPA